MRRPCGDHTRVERIGCCAGGKEICRGSLSPIPPAIQIWFRSSLLLPRRKAMWDPSGETTPELADSTTLCKAPPRIEARQMSLDWGVRISGPTKGSCGLKSRCIPSGYQLVGAHSWPAGSGNGWVSPVAISRKYTPVESLVSNVLAFRRKDGTFYRIFLGIRGDALLHKQMRGFGISSQERKNGERDCNQANDDEGEIGAPTSYITRLQKYFLGLRSGRLLKYSLRWEGVINGDLRLYFVNGSDKAITAFGESLDVARFLRIIAERLAQFAHRAVQTDVEVDESVGGPQFLLQLFASNDVTGVADQFNQHLEWLFLEPDADSFFPQLCVLCGEFKGSEAIETAGTRFGAGGQEILSKTAGMISQRPCWTRQFAHRGSDEASRSKLGGPFR